MLLDNRTGYVLLVASAVTLGLVWLIVRIKRGSRPPRFHPRLQKYAGDDAEYVHRRRAEAAKVIATSSTSSVAGYELIQQVEAVYVDGFRRPEEALEGIKAVAAMKGANAVINIRHDRSAGGKCSASGDAVIVRKVEV